MKSYANNSNKIEAGHIMPLLFQYISSLCLFFILIFTLKLPAYAEDRWDCKNGERPAVEVDCRVGRCGICDADKSSNNWANPSAEIVYQAGSYKNSVTIMPITNKVIEVGKCDWVFGTRFCVRPAKPARLKNDGTIIPGEPGNNTGNADPKLGRPLICAYEDPMDGMDTESFNGPYHEGSTNYSAVSLKQATTYGSYVGGLGALGGVIVGGILQKHNHVVATTIGCIDRKIGPMPPRWTNNAWFNNSMPIPVFEQIAGSIFESPKIKAKICKESATSARIVSCNVIGSIENTSLSIILNPNPDNSYKDCKTMNYGGSFDAICAEVSSLKPNLVTMTMMVNGDATEVASLERPGYIPKPVITEAPDSTNLKAKIIVTLRGKTLTLTEATADAVLPDDKTSGILHQVAFSAARPCVTPPAPGTLCTNLQNMVCVEGYNTAPMVAVNKATGVPVAGLPNMNKIRDIAFDNTSANKENGNYLQETFNHDILIYSGTGADLDTLNGAGVPVTGTQALRPASAAEAGLCLFTPPDKIKRIYDYTPTTQTYVVPVNCSQISIEAWGGGAAGGAWNGNGDEGSGGEGGYGKWTIPVNAGQSLKIDVAKGGTSPLENGGTSKVSLDVKYVQATGGIGNGGRPGGNYNTAWPGAVVDTAVSRNGLNGTFSNTAANGPSSLIPNQTVWIGGWDCYDDRRYHPPVAGGGCQCDDCNDDEPWGPGGNGKVAIACIKGMN